MPVPPSGAYDVDALQAAVRRQHPLANCGRGGTLRHRMGRI